MKKTFALVLMSLCLTTSAHAQWPWSTPTPVPVPGATPAPTPSHCWPFCPSSTPTPTATPGPTTSGEATPTPSAPISTPAPVTTPVPTPAPSGGGTWIKLPIIIQSAHPFVSADCRLTQVFPVNFPGASSIKLIVKKASFGALSRGNLQIMTGMGTVFAKVPGSSSTDSYTIIVPGDKISVSWSCYSNALNDYGFDIEEIYASLQ